VTTVRTVTSSSVELNWIDNVNGEQGWRVQWSFDGWTFDHYENLAADSTFWTHTGLPDGTRVWYRTRAYGNGQDTAYTPKAAATTVLPAPGAAVVTALDDGRYEITFVDNSVNEGGFVVEVTGSGTQTYTAPANGDGEASLTIDTIEQPGTYEVKVRATGLQDSATTLSGPYGVAAPRNLELRATGPNTVSLRWRDRSSNEAGFRIERLYAGNVTQIGTVLLNMERWTNFGVLAS
jgi:titin